MAELKKLNGTLQENIITLLAHNDTHGRVIAGMIKPQLFEGEYRVFAERMVDYWERYGEAPKYHINDLFEDIISDPKNRKARTYQRIIASMADLAACG